MSRQNPRKAVAAMLPPGTAEIRPMTLGVYAALERIGSPLVTGEEPKDTLELLPSLYLLTHDPREVFRGNVLDLAMQWADTQPVEAMARIRDAAWRQMAAFFDVVPQAEKKKESGNDGWIANYADWAARTYHWSWKEIMWEVPASALALLRRQGCKGEDGEMRIFPLSEIEKIDDGQETQSRA